MLKSIHAYSDKSKKSTPFALKKIRCDERSTNEHAQHFLRAARRESSTLFTHFFHFPSLYSKVYLYTQMIAIQRTSASPLGATRAPRSSNVTSRKNHRAGAAASIIITTTTTRRDGMRSHVTSMGRRTKNSFRLPAIAMPSPEVNEQMQTMTYNETGKWRENFDLASWAKEIREVRFSRPFNSNDILFPGGDKDVDCVRFKRFVLRFVHFTSFPFVRFTSFSSAR